MVPRSALPIASIALVLAVFAGACGSDATDTDSIASLADTVELTTDEGQSSTLSTDEAALAFSECLRSEGIDIADIGVDADGNIDLRNAFQDSGIDPRGADFASAREICFPLLDGIAFGGGRRAGLADNQEIQDALLEFSDCIRGEGFDVGDAELPQPGQGGNGPDGDAPADGEAPERGQGRGQDGFGDPSTRFATLLGLDPADPDVAAALEVCGPIISEAFAGFGPNPGN